MSSLMKQIIESFVATSGMETAAAMEYLAPDVSKALAVPIREDEPLCLCACGCGREVFYENIYEIRMLVDHGRVHQFAATTFASPECREKWWATPTDCDLFNWVYVLRTWDNKYYAQPNWPRCHCCTRKLALADCERCNMHGYRIRILPNGHRISVACSCLKDCGDVGPLETCTSCSGTGDDKSGPMHHSDDLYEPACDRNFPLAVFTMHRPTRSLSVFAQKFWGPREMNEWWRTPVLSEEDTLAGLLARAIPQRDAEALESAAVKRERRRLKRMGVRA
jgi:hypothetical protein